MIFSSDLKSYGHILFPIANYVGALVKTNASMF